MAAVSQFSTQENYNQITAAIEQFKKAIAEAEIAKQAGIPSAETMLSQAQDELKKAELFYNTYFPMGAASINKG